MRQEGSLLKRQPVAPGDLSVDLSRFRQVVADMEKHGGELAPSAHWLQLEHLDDEMNDGRRYADEPLSEETFKSKFSSMDQMMYAWVGPHNLPSIDGVEKQRYAPLLSTFDPLGLWAENIESPAVAAELLNCDLGSIMDLNVIYAFGTRDSDAPTTILEVGGGYGRLAEAALNVFGDSVRYVMVDAVPVSLCYATEYMRRACPGVRVGSYYDDDEFDLDRYQCYIAPAWHFNRLNNVSYDVCVNIESFQEMSQSHVDYYLGLFDAAAKPGGMVYVSNSHEYVFRGEWRYPRNWRKLLGVNTPRSWTEVHPTEVFHVEGTGDFTLANLAIDAFSRQAADVQSLRKCLSLTRNAVAHKVDRDLRGAWQKGKNAMARALSSRSH